MINQKNKLTVSILGKSYSLVTDEDRQIVENAAKHVESLMQKLVHPATSPAETAKKTTFVALQIAVDLLKRDTELNLLSNKVAALDSLLKESLN